MAAKVPESVLVVVHTATHALLLERADVAGFRQSVTGSLEAGETPLEAARREVGEETGLAAGELVDRQRRHRFAIEPAWRQRYSGDARVNLEHAFRLPLARRPRLRLDPSEHTGLAWRPLPAAAAEATSWSDRYEIRSLPLSPRAAEVVIVHGLWVGPSQTALLAARLRRAGFRTHTFGYRSTRTAPARAARQLAALIARLDAPAVHLVGHSLGGIVLAHLLATHRPPGVMRAVVLGSPMQGATAAHALDRKGLGWSLGRARESGLLGDAPAWPRDVPVAALAGTLACGQGLLTGPLPRPNDGVVALRDTALPGARRLTLATNHVGLLVDRAASWACIGFLMTGSLPVASARYARAR